MTDNNWKKKLQDKMAHYEEPVPDGLWESIERNLPAGSSPATPHQRKTISLWVMRVAAAAACIAIALLIGREWLSTPEEAPVDASNVAVVSSPTTTTDVLAQNLEDSHTTSSPIETGGKSMYSHIPQSSRESSSDMEEQSSSITPSQNVETTENSEGMEKPQATIVSPPESSNQPQTTIVSPPESSEQPQATSPTTRSQRGAQNSYTHSYQRRNPIVNKEKLSVNLYASNAPIGADAHRGTYSMSMFSRNFSNSSDIAERYLSGQGNGGNSTSYYNYYGGNAAASVDAASGKKAEMDSPSSAGVTQGTVIPSGVSNGVLDNSAMVRSTSNNVMLNSTYADYKLETKHHQPIRMGVSLRYALNDKWSVESGITYTLMNSDIMDGTPSNYYHTDQTLHYIGIPVNALYSVWSKNHFNVYALGGGMVEKNIKGTVQMKYIINQSTIKQERGHITENRLQWSLNAGAGIQWGFNDKMGLYAEPTVSFYPDNGSNVQNYYKDKKLNFNLKIGFRYSLYR